MSQVVTPPGKAINFIITRVLNSFNFYTYLTNLRRTNLRFFFRAAFKKRLIEIGIFNIIIKLP